MKAVVLQKYGTPDFFELIEVKKPVPKDNEVSIKVHAVAINSWDWEILIAKPFVNRVMVGLLKPTRIKILGCDIAGQIEAVGSNVKQFQPGDAVFGDLSRSGWGGFAEYVCANENALTRKPSVMTFEQAAAVPQAGLLALQGLQYKSDIQAGQRVLINGASGGVGTFAVQIAKAYGAEVTGVCSTGKMDGVRELGADHVIDYTQEDFTRNGQRYDRILDVKGFHSIFDYKRALSPGGIYVMAGGCSSLINQVMFLGPLISLTSNKKMGLLLHKANKGLNELIELIESGKVRPVIDKRFSLDNVSQAMQYFGEGRARGKVVVSIEHNPAN
ncbi:NAD(P)-dependent alcohol dehydrogenase [Kaarinaea lacus]